MNKRILTIASAALALVLLFGGTGTIAHAAFTPVPWLTNSSYPAPTDPDTGLPAYVPFEQILSPVDTGNPANHSQVLQNSGQNNVAVQITNGLEQTGSIWSDNPLDLSKSFDARMSLYFNSGTNLADGMAFAMTGTKPTRVYGIGSALGVWRSKPTDGAAAPPLPKSFVITFDTVNNSDRQDANVVGGVNKNYVGWGYPEQDGQSATNLGQLGNGLQDLPILWSDGSKNTKPSQNAGQAGLGGYKVLNSLMTDGTWHPLHIQWTADSAGGGTFHFTFTVGGQTVEQSIKWSASDLTKYFGGNKVFWGFTGTTGQLKEDAVVAFQSIPGVLDNSLSARATSTGTVYPKSTLTQDYTLTYNPNNSLQQWPQASGGTQGNLYAQLQTGSHYGFVVSSDGKVHLKRAGQADLLATPAEGQTLKYMNNLAGNQVGFVSKIEIQDLPPFKKPGPVQTYSFTAPLIARDTGAAEKVSAGTVIGNNGQATASVDLPEVKVRPLSVDAVPSFHFGTVTVADIMNGLNASAGSASSNISASIPDGAQNTLTASLSSFKLGPGYQPGSAKLTFNYNGQARTLKDDGSSTQLFAVTGDQLPTPAVKDPTLTIAPYAHVTVGKHQADILWTLSSVVQTNQ